jgi:hypothetical protein
VTGKMPGQDMVEDGRAESFILKCFYRCWWWFQKQLICNIRDL